MGLIYYRQIFNFINATLSFIYIIYFIFIKIFDLYWNNNYYYFTNQICVFSNIPNYKNQSAEKKKIKDCLSNNIALVLFNLKVIDGRDSK